jgi:crossover junction endodeoxyribonuclease RuvC
MASCTTQACGDAGTIDSPATKISATMLRSGCYHPTMRILGVDPGTQLVGYGCLELRGAGSVPRARAGAVGPESIPMAHRVGNLVQGRGQGSVEVLGAGVVRLAKSKKTPIADRLWCLALELRRLIEEYQPTHLALEEAFCGKSVQAALRLGEARGVILAEAAAAGIEIQQFAPARIKRVVTGSGAAGKAQVAEMVQMSLRLPEPPETLDVTDALAVGLCCIEESRNFRLGAG